MKKIAIPVIVVIMVLLLFMTMGALYYLSASEFDLYVDQPHANNTEILDADNPTIYYYYQATCHYCNSVKDQLSDFAQITNKMSYIDFQLIDMKADENKPYWATDDAAEPQKPEDIKTADDVRIVGTPTMIYVEDHTVKDIGVGDGIFDLLENVEDIHDINYAFDRSKYGQS